MFLVRRKTDEEIAGTAEETYMSCEKYNEKFMSGAKTLWHCDACNVLFEPHEIIIARVWGKENSPHCPRPTPFYKKLWWGGKKRHGSKLCFRRLSCGQLDWWEKNYHLQKADNLSTIKF